MSMESETSPVKPTVIDLDPDQVIDEGKREEQTKRDDQAGSSTPKPAAARSSNRVGPLVLAALLVGAAAGAWFYRNTLSSYWPADQVKTLQARVDLVGSSHEEVTTKLQALDRLAEQLKADVDAIEANEAGAQAKVQANVDKIAEFETRLAAIETANTELKALVAALQAQPVTAATPSGTVVSLPPDVIPRIEALEKDMASLKTQETGRADAAALTQALSDLKAKVEAGVPFADEQARIARMVPAAAGLDTLSTYAAQGLPAAKGLAGELAALRPTLPLPQVPVPNDEPGMVDRMLDVLSSVITIRDLNAANWQQVADQAIAFAEAGDLVQAVAAIDAVQEAKPPALQQWRDRASGRIALEAALAEVSQSVQRDLAARP